MNDEDDFIATCTLCGEGVGVDDDASLYHGEYAHDGCIEDAESEESDWDRDNW